MSGLVGQNLGRYEIVDLLGAGGMGEVYRAKDTQLGRPVAIKVISAKTAQSRRAITRFEREAKTVAQLSHPNILEIHDFGRDSGVVYAVTELLEGRDLRDRMRGSMLPLSKALEIGAAVANGLAAAHSKGIVHRDIKPENIFVTSTGQVKILDFGIAGLKADSISEGMDTAARTDSLTMTGDVLGTVGYMSPEQVRGEKADQRSDIFALGCVLYEVLTGRRTFLGETPDDTVRAILHQDPKPIAEFRSDISTSLEAIVRRCLEKQADERFDSARDVAFALQAMSGTGPVVPHPQEEKTFLGIPRPKFLGAAAAVCLAAAMLTWMGMRILNVPPPLPEKIHLGLVPIETPPDDTRLAAFGAGIGEELLEDLALLAQQENGIGWVVPSDEARNSGTLGAGRLGQVYGTTLAIEGKLERLGERIRLTLTIVDPATDKELRSATIEDFPGNVEAFQRGPFLRVAEMLEVQLTQTTIQRLEAPETTMAGAFDFHIRGRGILASSTGPEDVAAAVTLLENAVAEDPLFESAWLWLARSRFAQFESTGGEDLETIEVALEHARRALELGGRPDQAWAAIGALEVAAGRTEEAIAAYEEAVGAAPDDAELRLAFAGVLQGVENTERAEAEFRSAIYLRPDYWVGYDRLAKLYLTQGKFEAAAVEFHHVIDCAPDFALGYVKAAAANIFMERADAAIELLEISLEKEPTTFAYSNLGKLFYDASRFSDAAAMFELALEYDPEDHVSWGNLAVAYMFSHRADQAETTFRRAVELAEAQRSLTPDDLWLCVQLASYYAMLDEQSLGLEVIATVIEAEPSDPRLIAWVAEDLEDLNEREQALEWVRRSFAAGVPPSRFENSPTLRGLVADERYQALVEEFIGAE